VRRDRVVSPVTPFVCLAFLPFVALATIGSTALAQSAGGPRTSAGGGTPAPPAPPSAASVDAGMPAASTSQPPTAPVAAPSAPVADAGANDSAPVDTVLLTDGTSVAGHVVQQQAGSFVTIRLASGEERTISWARVGEVKLAPRPASDATPAPVPAPVPSASATTPAPPSEDTAPWKPLVTQRDNGIALDAGGTLDDAEKKRLDWKKRGGALVSYEIRGDATYLSGQGLSGYGAGAGGRLALFYMSPPDQAGGSTTWYAFRLGVGYDWSYYHVSAAGTSSSLQTAQLPFALGGHVGLGGFGDAESWSGVVLGVSWAPAFSSSKVSGESPTGQFNYAGAELSLDFTSLDAIADTYGKKAHWRVSAFILPPVTSSKLFLATFGIGAVWY